MITGNLKKYSLLVRARYERGVHDNVRERIIDRYFNLILSRKK